MNTETVSGKFLAGDDAVNVECGFVPDYIRAISALSGTELEHEWWRVLYDTATQPLGMYGFNQAIGALPTPNASAAAGIIPYDASVESVMLPAPDGHGYLKAAAIADYNVATIYVARTAAALGTVLRPTIHNGFVYECVTSSGGASPEPLVWGTVVGEVTTDLAANDQWICREERVVRTGVKGFTVGVDLATDGEYWVFTAEKHSRHTYMGDADVENPVTFGDHYH